MRAGEGSRARDWWPKRRKWPFGCPIRRSFVEASVEFVVVGGFAVAVHGEPRFTADIDVFVRSSKENARRVRAALAEFGFGDVKWAPDEFGRPDCTVMLGRKPLRIDILTGISGVDFESAHAGRTPVDIAGVAVPFIGRSELIANKLASGRPKDLADLETLGVEPE